MLTTSYVRTCFNRLTWENAGSINRFRLVKNEMKKKITGHSMFSTFRDTGMSDSSFIGIIRLDSWTLLHRISWPSRGVFLLGWRCSLLQLWGLEISLDHLISGAANGSVHWKYLSFREIFAGWEIWKKIICPWKGIVVGRKIIQGVRARDLMSRIADNGDLS